VRSLALLLLPLLFGCPQPSRGSVEVPASATALGDLPTFELDDGTAFELTRATVRFGDVRLEAPPDETAGRFALVRAAHAHPGHDFAGAASGELLGEFEVDLLAGESELGTAVLLEGEYATARLAWPADAPAVELAGTVTAPGCAPLPFSFAVSEEREITGMDFVATVDDETPPSRLTLRVDLATMLAFSDWTTPDDGDGTLTETDGVLGNTVVFGARTSAAWTWEIE